MIPISRVRDGIKNMSRESSPARPSGINDMRVSRGKRMYLATFLIDGVSSEESHKCGRFTGVISGSDSGWGARVEVGKNSSNERCCLVDCATDALRSRCFLRLRSLSTTRVESICDGKSNDITRGFCDDSPTVEQNDRNIERGIMS